MSNVIVVVMIFSLWRYLFLLKIRNIIIELIQLRDDRDKEIVERIFLLVKDMSRLE